MATIAEVFSAGLQQHQAGNLVQAEGLYRQVLAAAPQHADCHHLLGLIAYQCGQFELAVKSIRHALTLQPENADYYSNLAAVHEALGQLEESAAACLQALRLKPNATDAWCNLANVLARQNKLDEAIGGFQQALRFRPDLATAHYGLGTVFKRQGKLDQAAACYLQALRFKPNYAHALSNLANVRRQQGKFEEAAVFYEQALQTDGKLAETHYNRALLWLLQGNWAQGWQAYEWRWQTPAFARQSFAQPRWDGSALGKRTILLWAEQGLGDTIQFIRYVPLVKQRAGKIIVRCQPSLVKLLATMPAIDRLVAEGSTLPKFDVQAPLLSLPGIFQTSLATAPSAIPYLHADTERIAFWRRELEQLGGFKIGIAWQGNQAYHADRQRSIPLSFFARLAQVEGVKLVSLQKGAGTEQIQALAGQFPLHVIGNQQDEGSGPFMDTVAIMKNLDLVVCSDSAVAHLAGALGAPVYLAVPFAPDWRWLLQRQDSPWYPTMRLFRQTRLGDWDDVFHCMAVEVALGPMKEKGGRLEVPSPSC